MTWVSLGLMCAGDHVVPARSAPRPLCAVPMSVCIYRVYVMIVVCHGVCSCDHVAPMPFVTQPQAVSHGGAAGWVELFACHRCDAILWRMSWCEECEGCGTRSGM